MTEAVAALGILLYFCRASRSMMTSSQASLLSQVVPSGFELATLHVGRLDACCDLQACIVAQPLVRKSQADLWWRDAEVDTQSVNPPVEPSSTQVGHELGVVAPPRAELASLMAEEEVDFAEGGRKTIRPPV